MSIPGGYYTMSGGMGMPKCMVLQPTCSSYLFCSSRRYLCTYTCTYILCNEIVLSLDLLMLISFCPVHFPRHLAVLGSTLNIM